mmetsp:Transcript_19347/g.57065  ORF Transcript_19347/g.57065 Transcript_19347/m.57065 type:complete len:265 (-) Transcript_19347:403-1197(-)
MRRYGKLRRRMAARPRRVAKMSAGMSATKPAQKALRSSSLRRPADHRCWLKNSRAASSSTLAVRESACSFWLRRRCSGSSRLISGMSKNLAMTFSVRSRLPKVKVRSRNSPARFLARASVAGRPAAARASSRSVSACCVLLRDCSLMTSLSVSRNLRPARMRAVSTGSPGSGSAREAGAGGTAGCTSADWPAPPVSPIGAPADASIVASASSSSSASSAAARYSARTVCSTETTTTASSLFLASSSTTRSWKARSSIISLLRSQ